MNGPHRGSELTTAAQDYLKLIYTAGEWSAAPAWDEVHTEAEALEHAVSEDLITRMDEQLGHPASDPHGDPIPTAGGQVTRPEALQLTLAPSGQKLVIRRVADADPALLRYLSGQRLLPGSELMVLEPKPFSAGTTVRIAGGTEEIVLGAEATDALRVALVQ